LSAAAMRTWPGLQTVSREIAIKAP
jgi:hypothetical protein